MDMSACSEQDDRSRTLALEDAHRCWEQDVIPTLMSYARIPCLSPDFDTEWETNGHLAHAASLLRDWAASRQIGGLTAEVIDPAGRTPMLLIEVPATEKATGTVLIYGHLDKQPALGEWRVGLGPFVPVREGERLYGRGTVDDGYALFAAITALELVDHAKIPRPRVLVLIEASEESGSPDLSAHLDDLGDRLSDLELIVCLDGGGPSYDRLWLTCSLRGSIAATVNVQVLTEGVHLGGAGAVVPTSFRLLRLLLDRLEDPRTGEILLPELHAAAPASAAAVSASWHSKLVYPVVPGLHLDGTSDSDRLVRRAWSPALAVTGMDGMPSVRDGGGVLRPFTTAKISLRLPPTVNTSKATQAVEAALLSDPPSGAQVRVHFDTPTTGWVAPPFESWIIDAIKRTSEELFGVSPGILGAGGSSPFLALLGERYPGVPLVATGASGPGCNSHGTNECLQLPMAEAVTVATAHLIEAAGARN